jgi:hypothetical protein
MKTLLLLFAIIWSILLPAMAQETLNDALDNNTLTFSTGGDAGWFYVSDETAVNTNSVKSGIIEKDQVSWIKTTVSGPGNLQFKWKVSSKFDEDFLEFYIDGERKYRITGEQNWFNESYTTALQEYKDYEITWQYRRYSDLPAGADAGWLDHVVFNPISCLRPSNLHLKSLGNASALVGWHEANSATQWEIEYGLLGFTIGEGMLSIADNTPEVELTGLTKGETYSFYVRAVCGVDDNSLWVGPYSFMVDCDAIVIPFIEGFDVEDPSNLPDCWRSSFTEGSNVVRNTDVAKSARYSIRMVQLRNSYAMLIMPLVGVDISTLRLSFNALLDDFYAEDAFLQVGVIDNPYDLNTFTKVQDIVFPLYDANNWLAKTVYLDKYAGDGKYIAFKLVSDNPLNRSRLHIDNVSIDVISENPEPTNLSVSLITANSATISWVENGTATQWQLAYGVKGFDLNTEGTKLDVTENPYEFPSLNSDTEYDIYLRAFVSEGIYSAWSNPISFATPPTCLAPTNIILNSSTENSATISWVEIGAATEWEIISGQYLLNVNDAIASKNAENTKLLSDLQPGTWYQVYVRSFCAEDDQSKWTGPYNFTTSCTTFNLPLAEGFENAPLGIIPVCWNSAQGVGVSSQPQITNELFAVGSSSLKLQSETEKLSMLIAPDVNDNAVNLKIEFKALVQAAEGVFGNVYVGVIADLSNIESFVAVDTIEITESAGQWNSFLVYFNNYEGVAGNIAIQLGSINDLSPVTLFVDDILISKVPECIIPSNLVVEDFALASATLKWSETGVASKWDVIYGLKGFNVEDGGHFVGGVAQTSLPIEQLVHSTYYEFLVRSHCELGLSDWSAPFEFRTLCGDPQFSLIGPAENNILNAGELLPYSIAYTGCEQITVGVYLQNNNNDRVSINSIVFLETDTRLYNYSIPDYIFPGNYKLVLVYEYGAENVEVYGDVFEIKNNYKFLEISKPSVDEYILESSNYIIKWSSSYISAVNISYSINGGVGWQVIVSGLPSVDGENSHQWTVPEIAGNLQGECIVRVEKSDDASISAESNIFNIIKKPLTFISPNSESQIVSGDDINILIDITLESNVVIWIVDNEGVESEIFNLTAVNEQVNKNYGSSLLQQGATYKLYAMHALTGYSIYSQEFTIGIYSNFEPVSILNINAYPIPVESNLYLNYNFADESKLAYIFDTAGRLVMSFYLNEQPANMSTLKAGVYFVKVDDVIIRILKK